MVQIRKVYFANEGKTNRDHTDSGRGRNRRKDAYFNPGDLVAPSRLLALVRESDAGASWHLGISHGIGCSRCDGVPGKVTPGSVDSQIKTPCLHPSTKFPIMDESIPFLVEIRWRLLSGAYAA